VLNRLTVVLTLSMLGACTAGEGPGTESASAASNVAASSIPADRAALFDTILSRTLRRESFSEVKNERLGLDVEAAMRAERDALVEADTDDALYYALARLSTARRDRHLRLRLVEGGLDPTEKAGLSVVDGMAPAPDPPRAPIRFAPDYGDPNDPFFFIADWATQLDGLVEDLRVGDRLISVNGRPAEAWTSAAAPYMRASTVAGLRWKLAELLPQRSAVLPVEFYGEALELEFAHAGGGTYLLELDYVPESALTWTGHGAPSYPGFDLVAETPTFDLYRSDSAGALLLAWDGFREHMVEDMDLLVASAEEEGLLHYDIIFDATRSGGGSRGAYTIRRISPRPFKTTFGNLRSSDASDQWVTESAASLGRLLDSLVREADDDGGWLLDWLETGVIEPAPVHFTGGLVVLLGPSGGSHLDQFVSIISDNDLGTIIGMPAGGYSNTWEWEEVLTMPGTGDPVVQFMWSIGHTIHPSGAVMEGNPAPVDEWIPLTRDNAEEYYPILVGRAVELLAGG